MEDGAEARWGDCARAAFVLAVDPMGLGGVLVRAGAGPVRDAWLRMAAALFPEGAARRLPLGIADDALIGGLDLAATLRDGTPVRRRGLLAEAHGGLVVAAMAERMEARIAAMVGAALDNGAVEGHPARFALIALDEGEGADEHMPPALADRLAFHLDLEGIPVRAAAPLSDGGEIAAARARLAEVVVPEEIVRALGATALALGAESLRATLFAVRVARALAALDGRDCADEDDARAAAGLVLAPRATRLPAGEQEEETAESAEPPDAPPPDREGGDDDARRQPDDPMPIEDLVLAAAAAAIPPDLLARLKLADVERARRGATGKAGAATDAPSRGRPAGVRRARPNGGARLNLVETLRAAIPHQRLRGRAPGGGRIALRPDDFRATRMKARKETTIVFAVDASGSSALQRLGEAKGAVELVLAECYARRDRVALLGFRGRNAEVLLPPTRSLVRAKRSLAALPGGGGTPLAAAISACLAMADGIRRQGQTPLVVLLTDGRANVARDGTEGRAAAEADALAAAREARAAGLTALVIDTSPRPQEAARRIAAEMGATYLPLPAADPTRVAGAITASARGAA